MVLSPKGPYIDGVVWTLVIEAIFYATICVSIIAKQHKGDKDPEWLDRLALILGLMSGLFLLFHSATSEFGLGFSKSLDWFGYKVLLLHHGVFFALGIEIFSVMHIKATPKKVLSIILLIALCLLQIRIKGGNSSEILVASMLWLFMLGWLILSITLHPKIARGSTRMIFTTLGKLSYPIYLGHFVLGMYLVPSLAPIIDSRILLFVTCMLIVTTLAFLIANGPEPWGQRKLKSISQHLLANSDSRHPAI